MAGLTLEQAADRAGVPSGVLAVWEAGARVPDQTQREALAAALGCCEEWLAIGIRAEDWAQSDQERTVLMLLRGLPADDRRGVVAMLAGLRWTAAA
jgi:transcriptional regulator with XRE-family HTH domain